mmetsp:Transcript_38967/g.125175  ORF Transcript_38967/g.125175 Transcript_38967/m.125175 type:complete len:225 (-) Transcript_38967:132-806(-)
MIAPSTLLRACNPVSLDLRLWERCRKHGGGRAHGLEVRVVDRQLDDAEHPLHILDPGVRRGNQKCRPFLRFQHRPPIQQRTPEFRFEVLEQVRPLHKRRLGKEGRRAKLPIAADFTLHRERICTRRLAHVVVAVDTWFGEAETNKMKDCPHKTHFDSSAHHVAFQAGVAQDRRAAIQPLHEQAVVKVEPAGLLAGRQEQPPPSNRICVNLRRRGAADQLPVARP